MTKNLEFDYMIFISRRQYKYENSDLRGMATPMLNQGQFQGRLWLDMWESGPLGPGLDFNIFQNKCEIFNYQYLEK